MYFEIAGTTVRLMGSMHHFPKNSPGCPKWADEAFEWAEELILEGDPIGAAQEQTRPTDLIAQFALSEQTLDRLRTCWPANFVGLDQVPLWKVGFTLKSLGCERQDGIEMLYIDRAKSAGKQVYFLETARELIAHLSSIPLQDAETLLLDTISRLKENAQNDQQMYQDWADRQLQRMYERLSSGKMYSLPAVRDAVLIKRNKAWMPRIEAAFNSSKRTLVVVGALHLCGPESVLELLNRPMVTHSIHG